MKRKLVLIMSLMLIFTISGIMTKLGNTQGSGVKSDSEEVTYNIGDRGPAGGWIFYDKGQFTDGWRYLEAAPEDQGQNEDSEFGMIWAADTKETKAVETEIGTGKANTKLILKAYGKKKTAAKICADYRGGNKKDWFLPSLEELRIMYKFLHQNDRENFDGGFYWSSTEISEASAAGIVYLDSRYRNVSSSKYNDNPTNYVRAIRAF